VCRLQPGNSGGLLVARQRSLIGIMSAKLDASAVLVLIY
jgi:hypothetical protein